GGGEVGLDLGESPDLGVGEGVTSPDPGNTGEVLSPDPGNTLPLLSPDQGSAGAGADPAADQGERHLVGKQFIIREPPSRCIPWRVRWGLDRAEGGAEARPALAPEQGRVVPFGEVRHMGEG